MSQTKAKAGGVLIILANAETVCPESLEAENEEATKHHNFGERTCPNLVLQTIVLDKK